jgi:cholesterol transport system auxiliary component
VKKLTAIVLACTLAACSGSLFRSHAPPPSTYLLSVRPPEAAPADVPVDLTVLMPRVRTGLDTDHIAVLYPDRRLDYFAGARWSGSLDEVMQDLLQQALRSYGRFRNVHTDTSAFNAGYWLEVDVVDFQAEYAADAASSAPVAHVRILARVGTSLERRVLGQFQAEARQRASDNRLTAIVAAYNQAADQALATLAADTVQALENAPGDRPARSQ